VSTSGTLKWYAIKVGTVLLAATQLAAIAQADMVISTQDGPRTAIVLPAGQGPHPAVIVLHGAAATADMIMRESGFAEAAAGAGFTAVFPQGFYRRWHDLRSGGFDGPDDVAFRRSLIIRLIEEKIGLPTRVYIAGISKGGTMSFTMVCKAGDLIRGIGTVIANMPVGIEPCNPPPMPIVMINGTTDPLMPYDGGKVGWVGGGGAFWSVKQTVDLFTHRNGCTASTERPLSRDDDHDGPRVVEVTWKDCSSGHPVMLYRIDGGGHQIPGMPSVLPFFLGRSTGDISAANVIMSAFARDAGEVK
jgi:polyhydroxybutyrate depolymerase